MLHLLFSGIIVFKDMAAGTPSLFLLRKSFHKFNSCNYRIYQLEMILLTRGSDGALSSMPPMNSIC